MKQQITPNKTNDWKTNEVHDSYIKFNELPLELDSMNELDPWWVGPFQPRMFCDSLWKLL